MIFEAKKRWLAFSLLIVACVIFLSISIWMMYFIFLLLSGVKLNFSFNGEMSILYYTEMALILGSILFVFGTVKSYPDKKLKVYPEKLIIIERKREETISYDELLVLANGTGMSHERIASFTLIPKEGNSYVIEGSKIKKEFFHRFEEIMLANQLPELLNQIELGKTLPFYKKKNRSVLSKIRRQDLTEQLSLSKKVLQVGDVTIDRAKISRGVTSNFLERTLKLYDDANHLLIKIPVTQLFNEELFFALLGIPIK